MTIFNSQARAAGRAVCFLQTLVALAAVLALLWATVPAQAQAPWRNVQISGSGCWVTGIVAQPKVRGLFYARTDVGGCYRWGAATQTWIPITDFFPVQQRDSYGGESIAVDPNHADTVYIAAGEWLKNQGNAGPGTIYKSTNRGKTWTALGLTGVYMGANDDRRWGGERLAVDPHNSDTLLFGSRTQGLWRSADGGAHWQATALPYPQDGDTIGVQAVAFDPGKRGTVYAAVSQEGIFQSTDDGVTWANISTAITKPGRLVVDQTGTVWVAYSNGVSKYAHGQWTNCTPAGATADPYSGLAINPRDPKNVLVSYGLYGDPQPNAIFETEDGGASWRNLDANITTDVPWYKANNPHGVPPFDISNLMFDPNNPKSVWFVSGGGIWNTQDITASPPTFTDQERGHEELCVMTLATPPVGPELVAGTMDVDGFAFDNGVDSYPSRMFVDVGSWASVTVALAYQENAPTNMARLCVQGTPWDKPCVVATSQDGGLTWHQDPTFPTAAPSGDGKAMTPVAVAVSATDPANMVVAVCDTGSGDGVWFCKTGAGADWRPCSGLPRAGAAQQEALPLTADPVEPGTFYAYDGGMIFRSTDGGATWTQASAGPVGTPGPAGFFKLAAQPGRAGDLWLSEEGDNPNYLGRSRPSWEGLYHSADGGATWTKLPGVSRALTFTFGKPGSNGVNTLYIYGRRRGSSVDGIYRSTDLGASWTDIQYPGQAIGDYPWVMAGSRQTYGRVFIGTSGRGIYYSVDTTEKASQSQ